MATLTALARASSSVDDLADLVSATEEDLVAALRARFLQGHLYTCIRSSILLAVNPYKDVRKMVEEASERYQSEYKDTDEHDRRLPPHIFQQSNQAYFHMRRAGQDQSIVLSGLSGSGKSEIYQWILYHLITLSAAKKNAKVQELVQSASHVLESFGHARTAVNGSASRFGKYMELQFNERGRLTGAKFLDYCLDTSHIRSQSSDDRNFHVFYHLMHGVSAEERTMLRLHNDTFTYLGTKDNSADAEALTLLRSQLKSLGCNKATWTQLLQILAAILHLGNIQFVDDPSNVQESASIKTTQTLDTAADLLGVDSKALEGVLIYQTKLIQHDLTTLYLSADQASAQRDRLAQVLYSLLFEWLVELLNKKLCKSKFQNFIGILDFPGTDLQGPSSHSRFCVNLANEQLQYTMMQHVMQHHVDVYDALALERPVEITTATSSAAACIDLLLGPEQGLVATLNRAGTLADFLTANKQHGSLTAKRSAAAAANASSFTVQHFTGPVTYKSEHFTDNADPLCADFVSLFRSDDDSATACTNALARRLFALKTIATESHPQGETTLVSAKQSSKPRRSPSVSRKKARPTREKAPAIAHHRVGGFAEALEDLMATIRETRTWWVLCLRPNDLLLPNSCDSKKLAAQVKTFNVDALVKRAKHEYPVTLETEEFCTRYVELIDAFAPGDPRTVLMESMGWDHTMMVVDEKQVYLTEQAWRILENRLRTIEKKDQRRARCTAKGIPFDDSAGALSQSPSGFDPSTESVCSDDCYDPHCYNETDSICASSHMGDDASTAFGKAHSDSESTAAYNDKEACPNVKEKPKRERISKSRGCWVVLTWLATWWIPSLFMRMCGGMRRADIRMAWREKVTLCLLIFLLCGAMVWFIAFFGQLVCPHQDLFTQSELQAKSDKDNAYVAIRGEVFDLTSFAPRHWASEVIPSSALFQYAGQDASDLFPVQVSALCGGSDGPVPKEVMLDAHINITDSNAIYHDFRSYRDDSRPDWYFEQMVYLRTNYRLGFMGYDPVDVKNQAMSPVQMGGINAQRQWAILHNNVYDLTSYMMGGVSSRTSDGQPLPSNIRLDFIDNGITELFRQLPGTDISQYFDALPLDKAKRDRQLICLRNLFFVGKVDTRNSPQCLFSEYLLLMITAFLCSVILFKFLAALRLGTKNVPEEFDKFIVCQVPCYTEDEESLRKTIDSLAVLKYDDKRKLLFLIADGMIVGSGNDRSTPRIVLDILGVSPKVDPPACSFLSLGEGRKQHNMGKVYSGLYECSGHVVPFIVVVKVGTPQERQKPGNRGKRDSQMVLMRFLNKVHFDAPMSPLELEIHHQLKNVIGVNPSFYEFVLMVDADTEVLPHSLNRMVSCFVHDSKIVGLCGETMLSNEKESWVTMIQVYEYYISHHLAKAFESYFGSVTCLPGCFCMYRVRSTTRNQPLLASNQVIRDYAENQVNTLHKKNLLHLGEDRYLTTLILKHFPNYKTKFTANAACMTNAPDRWPVLLSQRRRWINSTVHNLGELMFLPQLCGFCCFSMRFVVMLDLLSTLVMPAVVCYLGYLVYQLCTNTSQVPLMSIITLAGVYGLQAIIFILRRKWEHIGWMIVYILAIPVFSFLIPIYAFWHFDDFSWGNTRIVVGEKGQKKAVGPEEGTFDPSSIPVKRWLDHEQDMEDGIFDDTMIRVNDPDDDGCCSHTSCHGHTNGQIEEECEERDHRVIAPDPALQAYGFPTDAAIVQEIEYILDHHDLMLLTKKQVRDGLTQTFGIDMTPKRDFINKCIESMLAKRL